MLLIEKGSIEISKQLFLIVISVRVSIDKCHTFEYTGLSFEIQH